MSNSNLSTVALRIISLLGGSGSTYFNKQFKYQSPAVTGNVFSRLLGPKWPLPVNANDRNVPQFIIDIASDERVTDRNVMKTFTNTTSAFGDVNILDTNIFTFRMIYSGTDRNIPTNMQEFIIGVLLADPTLGLNVANPPIVRISGQMTSTMKDENSERTGGTLRCIHEVKFPVTILDNRTSLQTMAAFAG